MDGYLYNAQMRQQQQRQLQEQQQQSPNTINPLSSQGLLSEQPIMSGNSLDEIVHDNQNTLYQRRRSMPHQQYGNMLQNQTDGQRRLSMVGSGNGDNIMSFGHGRNYHFTQPMSATFPTLSSGIQVPDDMSNYMIDQGGFGAMGSDMMGNMIPSTFANMNMESMGNASGLGASGAMPSTEPIPDNIMANGSPSVDLFSPPGSASMSQFNITMDGDFTVVTEDSSLSATPSIPSAVMTASDGTDDDIMRPSQPFNGIESNNTTPPFKLDSNLQSFPNQPVPAPIAPISNHVAPTPTSMLSIKGDGSSASMSDVVSPVNPTPANAKESKEKAIYSKSGFDMLKALWLVATRKNSKIHLGAVDMSCAFVVCDVTMNDCPIIYVSDNFQNLTGYSRHEIVGQNCRFLQAPDGKVESGSKREFVDDGAVYNLKQMIAERREVQQSLINYRKGGKPFLNLLTMIPIPWDTDEIRYFIGFQIDLVECPDAIGSGEAAGGMTVNYKHSDIGQYIWTPPSTASWEPESGQTLGVDDVSTLLQQFTPTGPISDWHKQSWDKMLLENTDDVIHVLSLKGLFLYLSPSCKRVLEYDATELMGNSLSTVCHPSDIVPVTRELKDTTSGKSANIVFRIRRKNSGYTWFESHGSLFAEQGKGRKCIILVGRKRPVIALSRKSLDMNGGIGDSELWTKLSTSGMFLFVSSNVRSLLDLQPEALVGTSIQDLMRKDSRPDFGRAVESARRGRIVSCKHEVQNRRGQVLQAQTTLYPGDAAEGQKPSFLLAQTKLLKASSKNLVSASTAASVSSGGGVRSDAGGFLSQLSQPAGGSLLPGTQDAALASDDNMFDELRTTKCSSWQFELRQMEKVNRILAEELGGLLSNKKKRKRRKGVGNMVRDCANCHTRNTPEWRRGPSGQRDLCNSCGLRWAKQTGRVSPRTSSRKGKDDCSKQSASPIHGTSPLHREIDADDGNTSSNIPHASPSNGVSNTIGGNNNNISSSSMPPPSNHSGMPMPNMMSIREERDLNQGV